MPGVDVESTDRAEAQPPFSEKDFYLAEFRGRTLALALTEAKGGALAALEGPLDELVEDRARVVVMAPDRGLLQKLVGGAVVSDQQESWLASLWHASRSGASSGSRSGSRVGLEIHGEFAAGCRAACVRLGVAKLAWLDEGGGLLRADGTRVSFVTGPELDALLADGIPPRAAERAPLLGEIRAMLDDGVPSVNLCSIEALADELFTYAGSGTLFTPERYAEVRVLGLDDLDAAHHLIQCGVKEGYLVARAPAAVDQVLAHGFGVFIEGRHLAGIGALLPHPASSAGEIASLYTLTRFLGEGVGEHLVRFALAHARERGFEYVFACTASERVVRFFEHHGFRRVPPESIPAEKWEGYDPSRRELVACVRHELR